MDNPLKNLINVIKTGSQEEVKEAQKQVEEFWDNVYISKRERSKNDFLIFLEDIKKFGRIKIPKIEIMHLLFLKENCMKFLCQSNRNLY